MRWQNSIYAFELPRSNHYEKQRSLISDINLKSETSRFKTKVPNYKIETEISFDRREISFNKQQTSPNLFKLRQTSPNISNSATISQSPLKIELFMELTKKHLSNTMKIP